MLKALVEQVFNKVQYTVTFRRYFIFMFVYKASIHALNIM